MNEEGKIELINTTFLILGILSIFFAGHLFPNLFPLSMFLFVGGVIVLSVRAVPKEEEQEE